MSSLSSTARLTAFYSQFSEFAKRVPVEKVRLAAMTGIIFLIITLIGNNFWFFLAPETAVVVKPSARVQAGQPAKTDREVINYEVVGEWQLFGAEPSKKAAVAIETQPAPDTVDENVGATSLNLKLVGIIHASNPKEGYAVILHSSKTELFKVGQAIPVGNDITLAKVLLDRVIINNRGNYESLMLFEAESEIAIKKHVKKGAEAGKKVIDKRGDKKVSQLMRDYRSQLLSDPMSMANVIRISLATDANGDVLGYRVRPGKHRKQFAELGLKSGDIITAINGTSLADQQNAMQLYGSLGSLTEANFDILRGGNRMAILVDLSN